MTRRANGAAAITAALTLLTAAPAMARPAPLTMFVFEPAFSGKGENPCLDRTARDVVRLDLKKEITQAPGLPTALTTCHVAAGTAAKARRPDMVVALYQPLGPSRRPETPTPPTGPSPFEMVILSSATSGQDAEYNRWYDQEHIPAVLQNPGFTAAQRLRLVASDAPSGYVLPRYGATYLFTSGDWAAIMTGIRAKLASGEIHTSTAFDYKTGVNRYYAVVPHN